MTRVMMVLMLVMAGVLGGCEGATPKDRRDLAAGYDLYAAKRYADAEVAAGNYLSKFPKDPNVDEAYYLRGVARMGRSNTSGAAQDFQTAITKSQRSDLKAKSYKALGEMAFDGGRYEQAVEYLTKALEYYPAKEPEPMVLYRLGAAYQAMGKWNEARGYLEKAAAEGEGWLRQRALGRKDAKAFALQFGAFRDMNGAVKSAGELRKAGINAFVVSVAGEKETLYTVRAGAYRTLAEADVSRGQMIKRYPGVVIWP